MGCWLDGQCDRGDLNMRDDVYNIEKDNPVVVIRTNDLYPIPVCIDVIDTLCATGITNYPFPPWQTIMIGTIGTEDIMRARSTFLQHFPERRGGNTLILTVSLPVFAEISRSRLYDRADRKIMNCLVDMNADWGIIPSSGIAYLGAQRFPQPPPEIMPSCVACSGAQLFS